MVDEQEKERRRKKLNKNKYAKELHDTGEHKGAFAMKIYNPKKGGPYNRKKNKNLERFMEEDEET